MNSLQVREWLEGLVLPHPSITDIEQRHQARLLAAFLLVLISMLTLIAIRVAFFDHPRRNYVILIIMLGGISLHILQYGILRRGYYSVTAICFVATIFVAIHFMSLVPRVGDLEAIFFVAVIILCSVLFLPMTATLLICSASLLIQLGVMRFFPAQPQSYSLNLAGLYFTLIIAPLLVVFSLHRNRLASDQQAEMQAANAELLEIKATLEERVSERTRDLQIASQVARRINQELYLDDLLPELVEQTRKGFHLYAVAVFLFHPEGQRLALATGTDETGRLMKTSGRFFNLDERPSLVARVARERRTVVANDVIQSADFYANPMLPETKSEMTLPMIVGDELIGVFDLQSTELNRFSEADVQIMTTLAEQITIAVKNARLFELQERAAAELRQADRMKSQFLASMSHEVRTPLNAILNFTEFVAMGAAGPVNEEQQDLLNQALESSRHLLRLINDVLDISKIQAGRLSLFIEDNLDLYPELEAALAMAESLRQDKPVRLVREIDPGLPPVSGDRLRIRQVLLNLLSNAMKFTAEGTVTLRARPLPGEVLFAVIDTGPGIPPEAQEIIFEPFVQIGEGIKDTRGTGLGLPISRSLARAHGGDLWVESQPGGGASFYFRLPVDAGNLKAIDEQ